MGGKKNNVSILAKSILHRKDFNDAVKEAKESPDEWLSRIKVLAKACSFGKSGDLFILDKFLTGLEIEIIVHLCSSAKNLNIENSLKIIHTYGTKKNESAANTNPNEQNVEKSGGEATTEQDSVDFSQISITYGDEHLRLDDDVKVEDNYLDFIDDSSIDGSSSSDSESDSSIAESEEILPKRKRGRPRKQKNLEVEQAKKQETKAAENTGIDPNAPKKKRKYKKRAVKEKQTFECEICHYKCAHQCHLRRHKLIHINEKAFVCDICGKRFNLFINLNAHIRRHIGIKPHTCDLCGASFMDKTRLRLHMRTHTGERPYGCTVCDKKFADRYYLKSHMRLHTGEKPFKCDQCRKTFSQSSSLSLHKKKSCFINHVICRQPLSDY